MNPNDHPHGGRTKAIRYQRTPWGKTAKKSRKPRFNPNLKLLTKRKKSEARRTPYWL
jgi:large subunit ribosomal protein L2